MEDKQTAIIDRPLFPLYLACGAFLAYVWATPLRDLFGLEARNGLFIKTMLADGPSLIPTIMGAPYPDYPPLYFWLSWLFSLPAGRVTTLSAVLPSALAAAAMVGVTFMLAKKISARAALIAALALATCPDYWLKAGRATIDMLLALWVSLAVFLLYRRHEQPAADRGGMGEAAAFIMMLLAFLTKGPVGLVLPVGIWSAFLAWEKKWRLLSAFAMKSFLLAAACIGITLFLLRQTGGSELVRQVIEMQFTGRVGKEPNEPLSYYLLYLLSGAAPWWIPACFGFFRAGRHDTGGFTAGAALSSLFSHEVTRLAACWFFFVLALFTAASTRHSRYLLPLFPALFLLIGRGIELSLDRTGLPRRQGSIPFLRYLFFLIVAVGTVVFAAAPLSWRPSPSWWLAWAAGSLLVYTVMRGRSGQNFQLLGLSLLCVGCAMAAEALLLEPWLSQQESGRRFVRQTESMIEQGIPVVLYKIDPDGDGIKYALHSSRPSAGISFAGSIAEINRMPPPFLLIAFDKAENELAEFGHAKTMTEISRGLLHRDRIKSWLIRDRQQDAT